MRVCLRHRLHDSLNICSDKFTCRDSAKIGKNLNWILYAKKTVFGPRKNFCIQQWIEFMKKVITVRWKIVPVMCLTVYLIQYSERRHFIRNLRVFERIPSYWHRFADSAHIHLACVCCNMQLLQRVGPRVTYVLYIYDRQLNLLEC